MHSLLLFILQEIICFVYVERRNSKPVLFAVTSLTMFNKNRVNIWLNIL